jgi:hypothetical protein
MTDNEFDYYQAIQDGNTWQEGAGTAVGTYLGGPVGGAIGGYVMTDGGWDNVVNVSDSINNTANYLIGTDVFPLFDPYRWWIGDNVDHPHYIGDVTGGNGGGDDNEGLEDGDSGTGGTTPGGPAMTMGTPTTGGTPAWNGGYIPINGTGGTATGTGNGTAAMGTGGTGTGSDYQNIIDQISGRGQGASCPAQGQGVIVPVPTMPPSARFTKDSSCCDQCAATKTGCANTSKPECCHAHMLLPRPSRVCSGGLPVTNDCSRCFLPRKSCQLPMPRFPMPRLPVRSRSCCERQRPRFHYQSHC